MSALLSNCCNAEAVEAAFTPGPYGYTCLKCRFGCSVHSPTPEREETDGPNEEDGPWAEGWTERSQGQTISPQPTPDTPTPDCDAARYHAVASPLFVPHDPRNEQKLVVPIEVARQLERSRDGLRENIFLQKARIDELVAEVERLAKERDNWQTTADTLAKHNKGIRDSANAYALNYRKTDVLRLEAERERDRLLAENRALREALTSIKAHASTMASIGVGEQSFYCTTADEALARFV